MNLISNKVMLLSDTHYGKKKDSKHLNESIRAMFEHAKDICIDRGVDTIIHMGDFFENRNAISLFTLNMGHETLKMFSNNGIRIILIVGNHDIYYKNSTDIASTSVFGHIPNIDVIQQATVTAFKNGKTVGLYPWETLNDESKNTDYCFGHFEFIGAKYSKHGIGSSHGYDGNKITSKSPIAFSGHYHTNKDYEFDNGTIHCIGCPQELDWSDSGDRKYFTILDSTTDEIEKIPNLISPRHIKLSWEKLKTAILSNSEKLEQIVKNNWIKIIVDGQYNIEELIKGQTIINSRSPAVACDVEFIASQLTPDGRDSNIFNEEKILTATEEQQVLDYCNHLFDNCPDSVVGLDRKLVESRIMALFESTRRS